MSEEKSKAQGAVQTTGHSWDGDLQEFNNPLPNWWLWAFYATVLFALIYWILYPAWPVAGTFTKGVLNTITFVDSDGNEKTTHWNTRSLLLQELQEGSAAVRSQEYLDRITPEAAEMFGYDPKDEKVTGYTPDVFVNLVAGCLVDRGSGVEGHQHSFAGRC